MNWNPDRNFRFDLGYVGVNDFNTKISELPYYDLTHLIMWTQSLKRLKSYIADHSDEIFDNQHISTALYSNVFIAPVMAFAEPAIKARFKADTEASIEPALKALHLTTANYVTNHHGKVDDTLNTEKEGRLVSGDIIKGDINEHNVSSVRALHPNANYVGRVHWILNNLEPVKEPLHEEYSYWQNILKLLEA